MIDDATMDRVLGIAGAALYSLSESEIDENEMGLVSFGIAYIIGALSLGENHEPMNNGDVAQAGHDLIMAYLARVEAEAEPEKEE